LATLYTTVTYTPTNDDFREILRALYLHFSGGGDANWSIDGTVTRPTQVAAAGDSGFALVNGSGVQILIADHAAVAGVCLDAGALAAADDLVVALVPSGGTTDMRSGSFAAGASFSGWAVDCQGVARSSHAGRAKIVSTADSLFVRFKTTATNLYEGGFWAGKLDRLDSGIGGGYAILGGLWTDWSTFNSSNNDHAGYLSFGTTWMTCRVFPSDAGGLVGNHASDGAGNFRQCPLTVVAVNGTVSATITDSLPIGIIPQVFASANGTLAVEWSDGATVVGYNMTGGSWVCLDDGGDAE
jgi:hypothetical protein